MRTGSLILRLGAYSFFLPFSLVRTPLLPPRRAPAAPTSDQLAIFPCDIADYVALNEIN